MTSQQRPKTGILSTRLSAVTNSTLIPGALNTFWLALKMLHVHKVHFIAQSKTLNI